jgi:hypothetical protein
MSFIAILDVDLLSGFRLKQIWLQDNCALKLLIYVDIVEIIRDLISSHKHSINKDEA